MAIPNYIIPIKKGKKRNKKLFCMILLLIYIYYIIPIKQKKEKKGKNLFCFVCMILLIWDRHLFEGRSPKISIIRWSVHVSLTARSYEQFRSYWPWHLIIIYKFNQIDEADCMFIFQIKHQYSFWIIAHILFNALLRVLT